MCWGAYACGGKQTISGILQRWHALRNSISHWLWDSLIRSPWWSMRSKYPPASVSPVLVLPVCTTPTWHLYVDSGDQNSGLCLQKKCVTDDKHPTVIKSFFCGPKTTEKSWMTFPCYSIFSFSELSEVLPSLLIILTLTTTKINSYFCAISSFGFLWCFLLIGMIRVCTVLVRIAKKKPNSNNNGHPLRSTSSKNPWS